MVSGLSPNGAGQALAGADERHEGELERTLGDERHFSIERQNCSYLSRGTCVDQLKMWMSFLREQQVLMLESDHLLTGPSRCLQRVLDFLKLPRWEPSEYKGFHPTSCPGCQHGRAPGCVFRTAQSQVA